MLYKDRMVKVLKTRAYKKDENRLLVFIELSCPDSHYPDSEWATWIWMDKEAILSMKIIPPNIGGYNLVTYDFEELPNKIWLTNKELAEIRNIGLTL